MLDRIQITKEVEEMCCVKRGVKGEPAPIPQEGDWTKVKEIKEISGLTHGCGCCAPQQGTCKLTLNVKDGIIQEALVETIGCSGMTHSAAMAGEILPGKTILEALNTDLVCDAINVAMRELFLQIVYGRTQTAFSDNGLPVGAGLEDLGKGLRSQVGTIYSTKQKGPRYLELAEEYKLPVRSMDENARNRAREMGVKTTDEFSFAFHGNGVDISTFGVLKSLFWKRDISLEVLTHVGYIDDYTRSQTNYLVREDEINVLREAKKQGYFDDVELVGFGDI